MKSFINLLVLILTVAVLFTVPAMAEGELPDGTETLTLDNRISFTYDKYNFKVDVDENGDVAGTYLGESAELVGFNIVNAEDTDAEAYIAEAAESYNADVNIGNCFAEGNEWYSFMNTYENEENTVVRVVYARNNDTGCWIVTVFSYYPNADDDVEAIDFAGEIDDELSNVMDTLSFNG